MKKPVASFRLAVALSLFSVIPFGQSAGQRANKQKTRSTPQRATLRICQGVPIPPGYVIVGYVTSGACRHGAYVLKKQENELPLAEPAGRKPAPSQTPQAVTVAQPQPSSPTSRPRRVNTPQAQTEIAEAGPPRLLGTYKTTEPQRPQLGVLGATKPSTTTEPAPQPAAETGPEEVGEGDVVRVDTNFVTVPVGVMDRDGRFVPNLKKEDFTVFENGIEQPIAYFEPTEKPFTVALLLDTSASTHFHLWEIKEAAINFAKQLRPQDKVLVVTFNDEVLLLTEVTNDLNVISSVIQENANTGDSTRLYDAVDLVVKERLNKIPGRKAVVLFTDGVDTSSYLATYQSTVRQAEELDALIYPIKYDTTDYARAMQNAGNVTVVTTTSNWPFPGSRTSQTVYGGQSNTALPGLTKADYERADQYLRDLAEKTGARLYQANDPAQLAQAFSRIAEELRRQYSLGYYPQAPADDNGERRQIRVRVRQPNLAVRARDSYVRQTTPR
jgi:VWFA-related protein